MKYLLTYPVGLILKGYIAYTLVLVELEKRKEQGAERISRKSLLQAALGK